MKYYIFTTLLCLSLYSFGQGFGLQNGDLIFQEACPNGKEHPIKEVTSSADSYQFTHVGIVYIDSNDSIYVLEATHPCVALTPLAAYLYPHNTQECPPLSVVGRLKEHYQSLIPQALEEGFRLLGKEYDYGYVLGNDTYYCSELVYEILKKANAGKEVFALNVMTFKSPDTGETSEGWIQYFRKLNMPIPEGEPGINPGAMSRAEVIDIVYVY